MSTVIHTPDGPICLKSLVRYEAKFSSSAKEIVRKIQFAFGEDSVSYSRVYSMLQHFRRNDDPSLLSGKDLDAGLQLLISKNPELSTLDLASELKITKTLVSRRMRRMGYVWKKNHWVRDENAALDTSATTPRTDIDMKPEPSSAVPPFGQVPQNNNEDDAQSIAILRAFNQSFYSVPGHDEQL